jgi:hypothetical protein
MENYVAAAPEASMFVMPKANSCYDFAENGSRTRKTVFLIPHVIRQHEDCKIISWRCNWGHVCESKCYYAIANMKNIFTNP